MKLTLDSLVGKAWSRQWTEAYELASSLAYFAWNTDRSTQRSEPDTIWWNCFSYCSPSGYHARSLSPWHSFGKFCQSQPTFYAHWGNRLPCWFVYPFHRQHCFRFWWVLQSWDNFVLIDKIWLAWCSWIYFSSWLCCLSSYQIASSKSDSWCR